MRMQLLTFVVDLPVAVDVGLGEQVIDLVIRHTLAQVRHDEAELGGANVAITVAIKHPAITTTQQCVTSPGCAARQSQPMNILVSELLPPTVCS